MLMFQTNELTASVEQDEGMNDVYIWNESNELIQIVPLFLDRPVTF